MFCAHLDKWTIKGYVPSVKTIGERYELLAVLDQDGVGAVIEVHVEEYVPNSRTRVLICYQGKEEHIASW
jgi:hypothetical protein